MRCTCRRDHAALLLADRHAGEPTKYPYTAAAAAAAASSYKSTGEITRHYSSQTATLESLAHPALDALMRKCNSTNLERVRKIKTQHQRLLGRCQVRGGERLEVVALHFVAQTCHCAGSA
jgi:hypothetical protein